MTQTLALSQPTRVRAALIWTDETMRRWQQFFEMTNTTGNQKIPNSDSIQRAPRPQVVWLPNSPTLNPSTCMACPKSTKRIRPCDILCQPSNLLHLLNLPRTGSYSYTIGWRYCLHGKTFHCLRGKDKRLHHRIHWWALMSRNNLFAQFLVEAALTRTYCNLLSAWPPCRLQWL